MTGQLPNFLIIGANKSGTSSLWAYLNQHPDVFMSRVKEPMYFTVQGGSHGDLDAGGHRMGEDLVWTLDDYMRLFADTDAPVRGEASTSYLANPRTPARIRETIPDVKMVAVLRDPVERARSAYDMYVRWGAEPLSFADALTAEERGEPAPSGVRRHYLHMGFYGRQLQRYFQLFDREQIRVYLYDDLESDAVNLVKDVFAFLGIDEFVPVDVGQRHNVAPAQLPAPVRALAPMRRLVPKSARRVVRRAVRRSAPAPRGEWDAAVYGRLVETYRDDVQLLEELLGRDLSCWPWVRNG